MNLQVLSKLPKTLNPQQLPQHVAVIMDGNGRWAARKGMPRITGHHQGASTLKEMVCCCQNWGIKILTVYAFSTENWGRPFIEVNFLMNLFENFLAEELEEMHREGVRIKVIGEVNLLPNSLKAIIERAMLKTANNQKVEFNVAINYGARQEMVRAFRRLAQEVKSGQIEPTAIEEKTLEQFLDTAGSPDPDLLIRTSGEMRLSNFLLWQMAYTEIYVTDTFWPDFSRHEFEKALLAYQGRKRRFGKL
jgi:undecaprenyl diphosphate synthase